MEEGKVREGPVISDYFRSVAESLAEWNYSGIDDAYACLKAARASSSTVFLIGNGGSAATASHMATDLGVGSLPHAGVRAVSLTDNNAVLTATGNDFGYDQVFARQLDLLARSGDLLIAVSASGNSVNLLRAVDSAKRIGMTTIGLTGFDGGQLCRVVDVSVHVPTSMGEYGVVEDIHLMINHALTTWLRAEVHATQ